MAETGLWHIPTIFGMAVTLLVGVVVIVKGTGRLREGILELEAERANILDPFGSPAPPQRP